MRRVGKIGLAAVLGLLLFTVGGIGLFRIRVDGQQQSGVLQGSALLSAAIPSGSLEQTIAKLQQRLRALPSDWRSYASLGLAYVSQARVTADPSFYPKAEGVLARSLELNAQDNYQALVGMGALALSRHDFAAALEWGEKARAVNPYNGNVYGVIGDALLELGRYGRAFEMFQRMVDTRPDLSSYARVSYAREIQGDTAGAIEAMAAAGESGSPGDAAWVSYQLGELYFNSGQLAKAGQAYSHGTRLAPSFIPLRAGLAKVAWARGRIDQAIARYAWVVERYPLPEFVIALGDLYRVSGMGEDAGRQYALVRAEERLFKANGVNVDLELALFDASHGRERAALEAARAEWGRRHSMHVADALAWALYANGRYADAARYADLSLSLGARNALFMFHAGMIRLRLGDEDAARLLLEDAMATNPNFSILYAPVAERTLAQLEGRS